MEIVEEERSVDCRIKKQQDSQKIGDMQNDTTGQKKNDPVRRRAAERQQERSEYDHDVQSVTTFEYAEYGLTALYNQNIRSIIAHYRCYLIAEHINDESGLLRHPHSQWVGSRMVIFYEDAVKNIPDQVCTYKNQEEA